MQNDKNCRPCGRLRDSARLVFARVAKTHVLLLCAVLSALLTACGARPVPPPEDELHDPIEVFEATLTRLEQIDTGRIRAWLEVFGGRGRVRVRQAVLYDAPDRVRIETISPFDTSLNVLVIANGQLDYYDIQSQQYYRGPATSANLLQLAPIPLTPADMVRVLAGGPPLDQINPDADTYTLRWNTRVGAYTLTLPLLDGGSLELDVRHADWVLAGARHYDAAGDVLYEVRGADFREAGDSGVVMPWRLRVLLPAERVDVELSVERYDLNPALPDTLFELSPPRGIEIIEL
jgi:outer membrane lipoprotein-sorting protein